jgi:hypothetical protein
MKTTNQPYADKLKSTLFQERKLEIVKRNKGVCTLCNSTDKELHVHIKESLRDLASWEYSDDMLITLCNECPYKERGRTKAEKGLITVLRLAGFLSSDILAITTKIHRDPTYALSLLKDARTYE